MKKPPIIARFLLDFLGGAWTPDNTSLQDHLISSWTSLAASLRNHPALIGYELYETPGCLSGPTAWLAMGLDDCMAATAAFQGRFAASLRSADGNALLFIRSPPGMTAPLTGIPAMKESGQEDPRKMNPGKTHLVEGTVTVMHPDRWVGPSDMASSTARNPTTRNPVVFVVKSDSGGPSMDALDKAMACAFIPLDAALSTNPHPTPDRIAGQPVAFGYRSIIDQRREYVLTLRQGTEVSDTVIFLPGGSNGFTVDVSDGRTRWTQGDPQRLVWTANPTIHTHTMTARPRIEQGRRPVITD
ncbi:MAG: hypothetical protein GXP54_03165 [Deltaproteobacteria bacterium]|nr:hypothetical protein [Deltaproteobacteria bacterium]